MKDFSLYLNAVNAYGKAECDFGKLKNPTEEDRETVRLEKVKLLGLINNLFNLYEVVEAHDCESLDCDRCGDKYCNCLEKARNKVNNQTKE